MLHTTLHDQFEYFCSLARIRIHIIFVWIWFGSQIALFYCLDLLEEKRLNIFFIGWVCVRFS